MRRDLVLKAKDGDHDAFTALVAGSIAPLHRIARLILRSDDRAADAVQEALMAAWLHIRAVRDPDRFDAWLQRLLVNACRRSARRDRGRSVAELRATGSATTGPDPAAGVVHRVTLERGFRQLSPEHRVVLVLHHYLGLPDAEAAAVAGIPQGTYKSRLHRATVAMRAALDADDRAAPAAREALA